MPNMLNDLKDTQILLRFSPKYKKPPEKILNDLGIFLLPEYGYETYEITDLLKTCKFFGKAHISGAGRYFLIHERF